MTPRAARAVVLLDIDGTLLSPGPAPRRALAGALSAIFGDAGAMEGVRFGGKTDRLIVREALPGAPPFHDPRWSAFWETYAGLLDRELGREPPRLLRGARELVDALLASPGVIVGLVTGNIPEGAAIKLRHAGLGALAERGFAVGAHAHDGATKADLGAVARRRSLEALGDRLPHAILGDTPADIACARAAGARAVAVATGSFGMEALAAEGPDALLAALEPLDAALAALLPASHE